MNNGDNSVRWSDPTPISTHRPSKLQAVTANSLPRIRTTENATPTQIRSERHRHTHFCTPIPFFRSTTIGFVIEPPAMRDSPGRENARTMPVADSVLARIVTESVACSTIATASVVDNARAGTPLMLTTSCPSFRIDPANRPDFMDPIESTPLPTFWKTFQLSIEASFSWHVPQHSYRYQQDSVPL